MSPFISKSQLRELLEEQSFDRTLGVDDTTEFLVETVYLEHWNQELNHRPELDGLSELSADLLPDGAIQITAEFTDDERVLLVMYPDPTQPGQYGLEIIRNDNLVYCRTSDQDPATEWQMNCMADDAEAAAAPDGTPLFKGDPLNI